MKVRAIIRIKNDTLYSARMKLGFSQKKLAELIGISPAIISLYENFRGYPRDPERIRKFEEVLNLPIGVLFPRQHERMVELRRNGLLKKEVHIVREVFELPEHFASGTNLLEDPAVMYERKELKENVNMLLDGSELDEREIKVLRMRYFEEMTFQAIGDKLNLTRSRVEQIERKALRRLKHPCRSLEFDAFRAPEDRRKMELEDGRIVDRCLYPFLSFQDVINARLKRKEQEPYSKSEAIKKISSGSEDYYNVSCGCCSYYEEYFDVFSLDDLIDRMKKDGWTIKYYERSLQHRCPICSHKA